MKRILCLIMTVFLLVLSMSVVPVCAEETTDTNCIYFQVPNSDGVSWSNFKTIFCHIWAEGDSGGEFSAWQSKEQRCTDLGNGYWSFDISGYEFKEDTQYAVIFSNDIGMQTYDLTLTSACKGDIAVCEGDTCQNPVDSAKNCAVARWTNNKDKVFPCASISSEGALLDPDGVMNEDIDRKWGSDEGTSIAMPKVEVPQEESEEETEETMQVDGELQDTPPNLLWIIIGGVVVLAAVIVIIVLVKKRK